MFTVWCWVVSCVMVQDSWARLAPIYQWGLNKLQVWARPIFQHFVWPPWGAKVAQFNHHKSHSATWWPNKKVEKGRDQNSSLYILVNAAWNVARNSLHQKQIWSILKVATDLKCRNSPISRIQNYMCILIGWLCVFRGFPRLQLAMLTTSFS